MLKSAKKDQADSVKFWLDKGADINYLDSIGFSALHYAAGLDLKEIVSLLITQGCNVNIQASSGSTPLMNAAYYDLLRTCYLLYRNNANIEILDEKGLNSIDYAMDGGCLRVQMFLTNPETYSESPTYYEYFDSAIVCLESKKNKKTINYLERTKHAMDSEITKKNPNYAPFLERISEVYLKINEYKKAEPFILEQLEIIKETDIKEGQEYAELLTELAFINDFFGDFRKADSLYIEAIDIEKTLDSTSRSYANTIHNYAFLNYNLGNYKKAEALYLIALNIEKKKSGTSGRLYATFLNNLALLYTEMKRYTKAEQLYSEAFIIREKYGEKDSDYQNSMDNLAGLYQKMKQYSKAIQLNEHILKIKKDNSGEYSYDYAANLNNLAMIYKEKGDFSLAENYLKQALKIWDEILGTNHPFYIRGSINIAYIYLSMNRVNLAEPYLLKTAQAEMNNIMQYFSFLSENERELLLKNKTGQFLVYKSFAYNYFLQKPSISSFAFNNELFSKSILLNTSRQIQQSILNSGDTALMRSYQDMKEKRYRINFMESQPINKQIGLQELEKEDNELNKELTKKSQHYSQMQVEMKIQWTDVQNHLKDNEAAVEFIMFSYYNRKWTDSTMYCALVLKKGMKYPIMVPLFEQKQLDSLLVGGNAAPDIIYAWRGVTSEYTDQIRNGRKLYNLIWKPIERELLDVETVYYSPSGTLHQISFAALPTDTAHYLCDQYNLVQLSSTRQLATSAWQTKPEQISSTALFGGIKYDLENQEIAELQRSLAKNDLALGRGFTSDSSLRSTTFGFLSGTKDEVNSIANTLQTKKIKTDLYTGINGNEEAFKALSNQNISVLHIATHGFFFPDEKEKPQDLDRMMLMGEQKFRYVPNPLLRSGLVLAGGNRIWSGEEQIAGMEDGILTALEISEMNLQNTELVVLSACETGLGDIKGGEGVFGLQRAFKLAGVKTIIMSLWKVNDDATKELMQSFYEKWLSGMDRHEAFWLAQQELKGQKKYEQPYYWAGFVMVD